MTDVLYICLTLLVALGFVMKRSVFGGVHWPHGMCAGLGGGGTGRLNGLVWRGQWEPQHDPGPLSGSLPSDAGCNSISTLAVRE